MGCSAPGRGTDGGRAVASLPLPLLTSRRHIDLLRVCSAADPLTHSGPARVRR